MAPKQPTKTTQISKVELPAWVDAASQANYAKAQQIAAKPYEAYGGQTVAGTDPTTQQAYDLFQSTLGTGQTQYNQANDLFGKAAQGINGLNRDDYMNPYIDNVEDKALGALDRQRVQALMGNADKAVAAKAFGGSRSAIVDAVTNSESINNAGLLSANLRKDAFDNASGLMQQDVGNMMSGGQGLLAGGSALEKQRGTDFSGLLGIGQAKQVQEQRGLDDLKGRWDEKQGHDLEQLNVLLSSLGMSPYGKTENSTKTTSGGGGTDWAQMGLGIFSMLMGLSDENEKTDIKRVGTGALDIPLYAYRYKGDPKNYPKIVGPMAQDIEKKLPGSTKMVNGKMAVPMGILAAIANG